jgi:hypothetical protein
VDLLIHPRRDEQINHHALHRGSLVNWGHMRVTNQSQSVHSLLDGGCMPNPNYKLYAAQF